MWQFEVREAKNPDYRLKALNSLIVILPGIQTIGTAETDATFNVSSLDYQIQCIRRKVEKYFSTPRCLIISKKVISNELVFDDHTSFWMECEPMSPEPDLMDIKLLFPPNENVDNLMPESMFSVRCNNLTNILFVRRSPAIYMNEESLLSNVYNVFYHPVPGSTAYNIMDCLSLTYLILSHNNIKSTVNNSYQLKCLQQRHQSSSVSLIVHDAFLLGNDVYSLLRQFALVECFIPNNHPNEIHAGVMMVAVSCIGFLSNNRNEVSAEEVSRLTRCVSTLLSHLRHNISQPATLLLVVKDVQLCGSLSILHESLSQCTSQSSSWSVKMVYLVGDASLRSNSQSLANRNNNHLYIGNNNTNNESNNNNDENEKKPFLSAATLLFKSSNYNREDETDDAFARILSEISLYLAFSSNSEDISRNKVTRLQNTWNYEQYENVRGLKELMHIFERRVCWPRLLHPLYSHLHENGHLQLKIEKKGSSLQPVTGVTLTGGINSGKTRLALSLSQLWQRRCLVPSLADVVSGLIGGTEENLKRLFQEAKRLQPSLLILEHFNSLLFNDNDDNNSNSSSNSFLVSLIACIDDLHRFNSTLQATHSHETQMQHSGVLVFLLLRTDDTCRAAVLDAVRALQRPDRLAFQLDLDTLRHTQDTHNVTCVLLKDDVLQMKRLQRQQWKK